MIRLTDMRLKQMTRQFRSWIICGSMDMLCLVWVEVIPTIWKANVMRARQNHRFPEELKGMADILIPSVDVLDQIMKSLPETRSL